MKANHSTANIMNSETRNGIIFAGAAALPLIVGLAVFAPKADVQSAQTQQVVSAPAPQVDMEAQKWLNLENQALSECARAGRNYVTNPRSYNNENAWINGNIKSDFVVIAPFTAENSFGQVRRNQIICYGNQGTITRYEVE